MSDIHRTAGRRAYQKDGTAICPMCCGSGQVVSQDWRGRSRKGGNASYRRSLEPGAISMAQRGRQGGRPRALRLEDLNRPRLQQEAPEAVIKTEVFAAPERQGLPGSTPLGSY